MSLNVSNLTVHHGAICAVNQVSLAVPTGKLAAIIGANGAGKTTLLRALSGLNKPTNGVVNWMGETITGEKPEKLVRKGISHVSEGKSVIPELTVRENLELGAIWRKDGKEMKESIDQVVNIFPRLGERITQRSDTLSGGERQMLAIGRAIMSKPKLLLLDEPSLGLAPLVVEQIFQTIRDLTTQMRLTVLLVEQNAMGALKIADLGIVYDYLGFTSAQTKALMKRRLGYNFVLSVGDMPTDWTDSIYYINTSSSYYNPIQLGLGNNSKIVVLYEIPSSDKKKIVVFSGAGLDRESGVLTFRDCVDGVGEIVKQLTTKIDN